MSLYFHRYPNDGLFYKSSVGLLWIFDALHAALIVYGAWFYGVSNFGNLAKLQTVDWSMKLTLTVQVAIILIVQGMYTYRLWLLSGFHHSILRYLVTAVVLGGFAIGVVLAYETWTVDSFSGLPDIAWAVEASLGTSSIIDVLISLAMCYYLRKSKTSASGKTSPVLNSRISQMIQFTMSCGIVTALCSLACLFSFIAMPDNLIFFALTFIPTRLYATSYVAMMNARRRQVRAPGSTAGAISFSMVDTRAIGAGPGGGAQSEMWGGNPPTMDIDLESAASFSFILCSLRILISKTQQQHASPRTDMKAPGAFPWQRPI
ncbi:hypothetical protein FB45DRAFT_1000486 [Roridomyces roridus]|uniref:DUF6534 domain-containing protein n=1 Tax=Roridomyces roridus TaxID=1738132 RepID=A0AAD7FWW1_9AGAR|nr:hypothetical protein FB45DRAFT_1000486 [Roridomyces roridus]